MLAQATVLPTNGFLQGTYDGRYSVIGFTSALAAVSTTNLTVY